LAVAALEWEGGKGRWLALVVAVLVVVVVAGWPVGLLIVARGCTGWGGTAVMGVCGGVG